MAALNLATVTDLLDIPRRVEQDGAVHLRHFSCGAVQDFGEGRFVSFEETFDIYEDGLIVVDGTEWGTEETEEAAAAAVRRMARVDSWPWSDDGAA